MNHAKAHGREQETVRRSLVNLLFAGRDAAAASAQLVSEHHTWPEILRLAETWSVVPQLSERLRTLAIVLPDDLPGAFRASTIAVFARSAMFASKAGIALQHMQDAGIPALAFKGVASMTRLYQLAPQRTIKDADILIESRALPRAVEALAQIGFSPQDGLDPTTLDTLLENVPGSSGNKAVALVQPGGVEIDLHWSVGLEGVTTGALLERSEVLSLLGQNVRVASIADCLLLTARHSVRENFAVDTMCRDLMDVAKSCALLASQGNLREQLDCVAARGGRVALLALTGILCEFDDAFLPASEATNCLKRGASPAEKKTSGQLRRLFFAQADSGAFRKDLLYLVHAVPARQILRGALTDWRAYRSFMRSMEEKLDGQELPLTQRIAQLVTALRGLSPSHLRSMRALARMKYDR
jgi:hypothetical protein